MMIKELPVAINPSCSQALFGRAALLSLSVQLAIYSPADRLQPHRYKADESYEVRTSSLLHSLHVSSHGYYLWLARDHCLLLFTMPTSYPSPHRLEVIHNNPSGSNDL